MKSLQNVLNEKGTPDNFAFTRNLQFWLINEFAPEIEKWIKEYLNNKQTTLHISDFCDDFYNIINNKNN